MFLVSQEVLCSRISLPGAFCTYKVPSHRAVHSPVVLLSLSDGHSPYGRDTGFDRLISLGLFAKMLSKTSFNGGFSPPTKEPVR